MCERRRQQDRDFATEIYGHERPETTVGSRIRYYMDTSCTSIYPTNFYLITNLLMNIRDTRERYEYDRNKENAACHKRKLFPRHYGNTKKNVRFFEKRFVLITEISLFLLCCMYFGTVVIFSMLFYAHKISQFILHVRSAVFHFFFF